MFLNISVKELSNFARKILSDSRVIHPQISMTKYLCFQYSVTDCSQSSRSDNAPVTHMAQDHAAVDL